MSLQVFCAVSALQCRSKGHIWGMKSDCPHVLWNHGIPVNHYLQFHSWSVMPLNSLPGSVSLPRQHLRSQHVCIFRFSLCIVWNISMICYYLMYAKKLLMIISVVANCWVLCILSHLINEFWDCVLWHSSSCCWGKGCTHCTEAWGSTAEGLSSCKMEWHPWCSGSFSIHGWQALHR